MKDNLLARELQTLPEEPVDLATAPVTVLPGSSGGFIPCPELLTEEELIVYLRIPQVSHTKNYHNVIENLKRVHNLPRIHICGKPLYPREAIREWIKQKTEYDT